MKLYLVEHRAMDNGVMSVVVAYIATSMSKARGFCRRNKDYDYGDKWWWAIYNMRANRQVGGADFNELCFVGPDGKKLDRQPIPKEMR